jgi:hypothetical protein
VPDETGATTAALRETDTINALGKTADQTSIFVLDRRTSRNVFDTRAVAFGSNPVNRHGAYFPNLPFGVDDKRTYPIWNNEAGHTYLMHRAAGAATERVDGLKVLRMTGSLPITPVASYYTSALKDLGLPSELTPAQLQAQLQAAGVDLTQAAAVLGQILSADEMGTVIGTLASPLPLQYSTSLKGEALVEPETGIVVKTTSLKRFFVAPDPAAFAQVKTILDRHASNPLIKSTEDLLSSLTTPRPAFTLQYTATPASVRSMAKFADGKRARVHLARLTIPALLVLLAAVGGLGAFLARRRSRPSPALWTEMGPLPPETSTKTPTEADAPEEREPALTRS